MATQNDVVEENLAVLLRLPMNHLSCYLAKDLIARLLGRPIRLQLSPHDGSTS
jgi:hypothetical protein